MTMTRASRSARYGALAERKARERYGLEASHKSWKDATTDDGQPVEIKAAMMNRASGRAGRFRIFKKYHQRLEAERGFYVFVAYRAVGRGITVEAARSVAVDDMKMTWYGSGGHRDSKQAKIPVSEIFQSNG